MNDRVIQTYLEVALEDVTHEEADACLNIGVRYRDLCDELGIPDNITNWSARVIARQVLIWHKTKEALRLDLLADATQTKRNDFAHDIGGILRHDDLQSARYALSNHPLAKVA